MSIEEAIKIIQNEYKCVDRDCDIDRNCGKCDLMMLTKEPILKAYEMAIQALSQKPCEDAVSREQVLALFFMNNLTDLPRRIKALPPVIPQQKIETCDDAISRDALITKLMELIKTSRSTIEIKAKLIPMIQDMPSVTQKSGKWIPVSERLPEDAQEVLYSTKTGRVFHGEYYDDNTDRKWFSYKDDMFSFNNVVTAWMPLPKPYEPQESEDKE